VCHERQCLSFISSLQVQSKNLLYIPINTKNSLDSCRQKPSTCPLVVDKCVYPPINLKPNHGLYIHKPTAQVWFVQRKAKVCLCFTSIHKTLIDYSFYFMMLPTVNWTTVPIMYCDPKTISMWHERNTEMELLLWLHLHVHLDKLFLHKINSSIFKCY
jgi:hypothetical protein